MMRRATSRAGTWWHVNGCEPVRRGATTARGPTRRVVRPSSGPSA